MILRRRLVGGFDALCGFRQRALHVAMPHLGRMTYADGRRHEALVSVKACARGLGLVARRQQCGAFGRGFQRLGDHHGDRLVRIANLVVLQQLHPEHERVGLRVRVVRERRPVRVRHHLDDAWMVLGRLDVKERNAAARDA